MDEAFTCALDGFVVRGENEDELVAQVERHIADAHPDLVGTLSAEAILAHIRARAEES
jgi:predicted small metal-binding protein